MNVLDCSAARHANARNPAVKALAMPHVARAVYDALPKRRTDGHVDLTAFGLRHSCYELLRMSSLYFGVELQVLQQRRVWFGLYEHVCTKPLFSLVSVLRIHTYPDTVDMDLLHIGRHLTQLRTLCLDINIYQTSGATYHECALRGLPHLQPLTRLTRLGVLCMDNDITLELEDVLLMSSWPTFSRVGLNLALVTTSHVRVTLPSAEMPIHVGTLRLQEEALIALCDSNALRKMLPSGFVLAPQYNGLWNHGTPSITPGRMVAVLHGWRSRLSVLVLYDTPYSEEVAHGLRALACLSRLAWYPETTGSRWGDVYSVTTVTYDSPDLYNGEAGDLAWYQKPAFMWLLQTVVPNLPHLELFRFGLGEVGHRGVGSGWVPDGDRMISLWQIASQCNTLPRNCLLGLGDPDGTGPSAARTSPFMPDDEADNIQPDAMRDLHFPADRSPAGRPLPLLRLK